MHLLVKWPSRQRPEMFFRTLERWAQLVETKPTFLFSFDEDDVMSSPEVSQRIAKTLRGKAEWKVCVGPKTRTKVQAINADINEHSAPWDVLLVASDDMWPMCAGLDAIILRVSAGAPDDDRAFQYFDGYRRDGLVTIPCMTRKYYERFRYVYHPSYKSLWCDNEWSDVARSLDRLYTVDPTVRILEHQHPTNDRTRHAWDDLYRRNEAKSLYNLDQENYIKRKPDVSATPRHFNGATLGTAFAEPLLTICVPTLLERETQFKELMTELQRQVLLLDDPTRVEVIFSQDDGTLPIGLKRQNMLQQSMGIYVCGVDDDDEIPNDYVISLVTTILANGCKADAIVFRGKYSVNGVCAGWFDFDIAHQCYKNVGERYLRTPNHLCPIRRELALRAGFDSNKRCSEDSDYAARVFPTLRSQAVVRGPDGEKKLLYHYKYSPTLTRTQQQPPLRSPSLSAKAASVGLLSLVASLLTLPSCGDSTSGGDVKAPVDVITIGGLNGNGLGHIERSIVAQCKGSYLTSSGAWNGWLEDPQALLRDRPRSNKLAIVAHSYGCNTAVALSKQRDCALVVLIDPVGTPGVITIPKPRANRVMVFAKAHHKDPASMPWTTAVEGYDPVEVPDTDHSTITSAPLVLDEILSAIKEIK